MELLKPEILAPNKYELSLNLHLEFNQDENIADITFGNTGYALEHDDMEGWTQHFQPDGYIGGSRIKEARKTKYRELFHLSLYQLWCFWKNYDYLYMDDNPISNILGPRPTKIEGTTNPKMHFYAAKVLKDALMLEEVFQYPNDPNERLYQNILDMQKLDLQTDTLRELRQTALQCLEHKYKMKQIAPTCNVYLQIS